MSNLYERLVAAATARARFPAPSEPMVSPASASINWTQRAGASFSADLARILALPRRTLSKDAAEHLELEASLRRPHGTMTLRPIQRHALGEARALGGLLAPIAAGEGKALITLLLPTVLNARTTVLLVPANLLDQTLRVHAEMSKHWRIPNLHLGGTFYPDVGGVLYVVSHSKLSSAKSSNLLAELNPDLVVIDEAHALAKSSARARRLSRYLRASVHTKLCGLSGTFLTKSIREPANLARYALGPKSPWPSDWRVLEEWAAALDPSDFPAPPGELQRFCEAFESPRAGFARRVTQTPGVVASQDNQLGTSLVISERSVEVPAVVAKALETMRATWCRPDGEEITDALTFSRHARQLAAGLYLRWIFPRNEPLPLRKEWLEARKAWHSAVRNFLKNGGRSGMDSPLLLARAAASGTWSEPSWPEWARLKTLVKPETEAVWVSDYLARDAAEWTTKNTGIVWTASPDLGRKIAELAEIPYYGSQEDQPKGIIIDDEKGDRSVVASVEANVLGKNLQFAFHDQLVTTPSSSGKTWEQLLARTHRPGQKADSVQCQVYLHTPEMRAALETAVKDAHRIQETITSKQRLTYCDFTFALTPVAR